MSRGSYAPPSGLASDGDLLHGRARDEDALVAIGTPHSTGPRDRC